MLQLLTCSRGHSWEADAADDADGVRSSGVCPVCGDAVDLLPLFDLAPSADAITVVPEPVLPQAPPLRDAAGKPVVVGFEIQEDLGRTPQGIHLYRAKQLLVNRPVLLKVVAARDDVGQTGWGALRGEAAALGRLNHPNITPILEAGERERQLFYNALEWVEGPTLAAHAAAKPLPPRAAARLIEVLARAVHAAHEQGVIHRGLRPACIRLQPQPEGAAKKRPQEPVEPPFWLAGGSRCLPRISDFGLARRPVEGDASDGDLYDGPPSYLAPEQAWGRAGEIGAASDVYALGAILYELLTGKPPFRGRTPGETLDLIRYGEPPSQLRTGPGAPVDLAAVCRKAMQRHTKNRYRTALDLAEDLRAFTTCRPVKAREVGTWSRVGLWMRRQPLAAALLLTCLLALGGVLTAYLVGVGQAEKSVALLESTRDRATFAENREAQARRELADVQKRDLSAAYLRNILLAERELKEANGGRARQLLDGCAPDLRHWEWHYLDQRLKQPEQPYLSLTGPEQAMLNIAYSPDGRWLAASSGSEGDPDPKREVRVWVLPDPTTDHVLTGFQGPIRQIVFRPDGKRLATVMDFLGGLHGWQSEVKEWDPLAGVEMLERRSAEAGPADVAYRPDGTRLVVAGNGTINSIPPATQGLTSFPFPPARNRGGRLLVLKADGANLAIAAAEGHDLQIYAQQRPWTPWTTTTAAAYDDDVTALAYNPATRLLASASKDGTAQVWDVPGNRQVCTLTGHFKPVTGVSFTHDGRRLATSSEDGTVCVWDPTTGQEILRLTPFDKDAAGDNAVTAVQFSPAQDDWQLAAVHGNEVRIFGPQRP